MVTVQLPSSFRHFTAVTSKGLASAADLGAAETAKIMNSLLLPMPTPAGTTAARQNVDAVAELDVDEVLVAVSR